MNIWQKIIFSCLALIAILLIYQNDRINAEMEVVKERVANIHKMQIDSSYRQYVQDFINNDFDASLLSTGQQKTVVLMILLAQCNYLVNCKDINPILLLDEIGSHLDSNNRQILLDMINRFEIQFFLTGTDKDLFSFVSTKAQFYNITEL